MAPCVICFCYQQASKVLFFNRHIKICTVFAEMNICSTSKLNRCKRCWDKNKELFCPSAHRKKFSQIYIEEKCRYLPGVLLSFW